MTSMDIDPTRAVNRQFPRKLKARAPTRWNSLFEMLTRFRILLAPLRALYSDYDLLSVTKAVLPPLPKDTHELLPLFLDCLRDVTWASFELQRRDLPTLGSTFVALLSTYHSLSNMKDTSFASVTQFRQQLIDSIFRRFFAEESPYRQLQPSASLGALLIPSAPVDSVFHLAILAAALDPRQSDPFYWRHAVQSLASLFGSQCVGHDSEWIVGRLLKNAAFFVLQSAPPTSTSSSASAPPSVPSAPAILPPEPDGDELIGSSASVAVSYVANPLEALRLQSLKRQRTAVLPQQLSPTELVRMEVEAFWRHTFLAHEKQPHSNPLSFWQFHEKKYPILSRLALRLLSLPSSSAEAERTFSKAGHIISSLRSQITPTNADRLIFVAMNKHLYSPSIPVTTSAAALAAEAVAEAAAVSAASAAAPLKRSVSAVL